MIVCTIGGFEGSWTLLADFIRSWLLLLTQQTDERAREITAAFVSISRANRRPELEDCSLPFLPPPRSNGNPPRQYSATVPSMAE